MNCAGLLKAPYLFMFQEPIIWYDMASGSNGYILLVKLEELNHFYMDISPLKCW